MSVQCENTDRKFAAATMGFFERYLTLRVMLCIVTGIVLGHLIPQASAIRCWHILLKPGVLGLQDYVPLSS